MAAKLLPLGAGPDALAPLAAAGGAAPPNRAAKAAPLPLPPSSRFLLAAMFSSRSLSLLCACDSSMAASPTLALAMLGVSAPLATTPVSPLLPGPEDALPSAADAALISFSTGLSSALPTFCSRPFLSSPSSSPPLPKLDPDSLLRLLGPVIALSVSLTVSRLGAPAWPAKLVCARPDVSRMRRCSLRCSARWRCTLPSSLSMLSLRCSEPPTRGGRLCGELDMGAGPPTTGISALALMGS
mmetsp:Transcript_17089/g.42800  ORF Transcript_17089/g.42800 Transcript_17089/m.42800 type:complete len:241 (+) Transcript_17089:1922-2644(+)